LISGRIVFIVNPYSGWGSTSREWPRIHKIAAARLGPVEACMTALPGDATRLTREHLLKGAGLIVCVGGDGTLNEVINGFMDEKGPLRDDALLAFVPNGTGCDFVRTVPIPRRIEDTMETIGRGRSRRIDLGRLEYRDHGDRTAVRYFHNVTSFGLGGDVVERVNRTTKAFGPFASFFAAMLASLLLCGKKRVRLRLDGGDGMDVTAWNIAVANGRYHGGGMLVAPRAAVDDGLLHVTVIGDLTLADVFYHLSKLYDGRIEQVKKVSVFACRKVEADSGQRVLLDMDGEQPGRLPAVIDIVPSALRMIMEDHP